MSIVEVDLAEISVAFYELRGGVAPGLQDQRRLLLGEAVAHSTHILLHSLLVDCVLALRKAAEGAWQSLLHELRAGSPGNQTRKTHSAGRNHQSSQDASDLSDVVDRAQGQIPSCRCVEEDVEGGGESLLVVVVDNLEQGFDVLLAPRGMCQLAVHHLVAAYSFPEQQKLTISIRCQEPVVGRVDHDICETVLSEELQEGNVRRHVLRQDLRNSYTSSGPGRFLAPFLNFSDGQLDL